jgi:geranylgeranyl diphosphate synthase type I
MQDVYFSISRHAVQEHEILNLYRFKTARYTFSIPLVTGAIASRADEKTISLLEKLGEHLGIIFQIKDDELGLFGTEEETGKPVGTDIREGKKTLYVYYLLKMAPESAGETLNALYDKKDITASDLQKIKAIVQSAGVHEMIERKVSTHKDEALKQIDALAVGEQWKKNLRGLVSYIHERIR